nr:hypothetical protein [Nitrosomonas communis]
MYRLFPQAFKDEKEPFQYKNIGRVIGAFEHTLQTPSCFDDFLNGDENALKEDEKRCLNRPGFSKDFLV